MQWNSPFGPFLPSSTSIPDALVYLFSHITLSHSTFLLFSPGSYYLSNIPFLLLLVPVHPFWHFHYFSFHLPRKSLPPATCSSSSSPQTYISKSTPPSCLVLVGDGMNRWRLDSQCWQKCQILPFQLEDNQKSPQQHAWMQHLKEKKPTHACSDVWLHGSRCIIKHQCLGKWAWNDQPKGKTTAYSFTQWNDHVTHLKQAIRNYLYRTIVHAVSWMGQTARVCISQSETAHPGLGNNNSIISMVQKCLWWVELSLRWVPHLLFLQFVTHP